MAQSGPRDREDRAGQKRRAGQDSRFPDSAFNAAIHRPEGSSRYRMTKSAKAYIGIGSNLGDRQHYIESSVKMLAGAPELRFLRVSEVIETAPLLGDDQPSYLNAVAEVETELDAGGRLKSLGKIETPLGPVREERWGPRTIDLDLLLFGGEI